MPELPLHLHDDGHPLPSGWADSTPRPSTSFMLRGSPLHARTCDVGAEACERCATECEQMASADQQD